MAHGLNTAYFREKLRQMLDETQERRRHLLEWGLGESPREQALELSSYDQHTADAGSETYERSRDLGLLEEVARQEQDIRDALERLDSGRFGICESCGLPIPAARMEALPTARLCAECAKAQEEAAGASARSSGSPSPGAAARETLRASALRKLRDQLIGLEEEGREEAWDSLSQYPNANSAQDDPLAATPFDQNE